MKFIHVLGMVATLVLFGCKKEEVISGKPASYWISQLEDSNSKYVATAVGNLRFYSKDEESKRKLREFLVKERRTYAMTLYEMDGTVFPDCGKNYLSVEYTEEGNTPFVKYFQFMESKGFKDQAIKEFDAHYEGLIKESPQYSGIYSERFKRTALRLGIPWIHGN